MISAELPTSLSGLQKLAMNLWWSWDEDAQELWESIDPIAWIGARRNPVALLGSLESMCLKTLAENGDFLEKFEKVCSRFNRYMTGVSDKTGGPLVAYFCMEYGIENSLRLYSGGLGILAGDILKESSDQGQPMVGIGLMYRYGYFKQGISTGGEQLVNPETVSFASLPLEMVMGKSGHPLFVDLPFPGRILHAQVWRLSVGRTTLYLLDSGLEENNEEDRQITSRLYSGPEETRIKQEILLGWGGIQLLEKMDIHPEVYHCNEGHAAFIGFARLYQLIQIDNLSFEEAVEVVRSNSLFTTHTSVPAAIDIYGEELLRTYFSQLAQQFNVSWDTIMNLGKNKADNPDEKFSMANLALRLSQEINAVSRIHRKVSCQLFNPLWENYRPEELPVGNITNGVHFPTWAAKEWKKLYAWILVDRDSSLPAGEEIIKKINEVEDREIWGIRTQLRRRLLVSARG